MNLIAAADQPMAWRIGFFALVLLLTAALTVFTMVKSKRLSDFLDVVFDERVSVWAKLKSFVGVWITPR